MHLSLKGWSRNREAASLALARAAYCFVLVTVTSKFFCLFSVVSLVRAEPKRGFGVSQATVMKVHSASSAGEVGLTLRLRSL